MVLWDSHGNIWGYPLAICSIAIENDTVIVDLPINDGDFPQLCQFTRGYDVGKIMPQTIPNDSPGMLHMFTIPNRWW